MERVRLEEGSLVIRTFEPQDRERVWEMHLEGLRDTGALAPEGQPEWDEDLRRIEEVYLGEGSHFWVIEERGEIIGMAAVRRLGPGTAELKRMRVTATRRRTGLGQRLLEIVEAFCREQGYQQIVLDTTNRQEAARRLYEKNGYVLTGERPLGDMRIFFYRKELA